MKKQRQLLPTLASELETSGGVFVFRLDSDNENLGEESEEKRKGRLGKEADTFAEADLSVKICTL